MSWPPRWDGPQFKQPVSKKVTRFIKRTKQTSKEDAIMRSVRLEDRYCRMPMCGCHKMKLRLDVSHSNHRGMGGNPKGDRTTRETLILLCSARHKENVISVDRKTLFIFPLTLDGLRGACSFSIDMRALGGTRRKGVFVIGRETARHVFEPFTEEQLAVLTRLAAMER